MTTPFRYPDPSQPPDQSAPFHYPDYNATMGIGSPIDRSEWQIMQERKNQLVQGIVDRMNLANRMSNVDPSMHTQPGGPLGAADHVVNQHQMDGQNADGSPTQFQDFNTPPHQEELNQLLGAANYWGIQNADKIPPGALKKIIEAKRLSAEGDRGLNPAADVLLTSAAAAGLGATQQLVDIAQHIPFIGSAIAHNTHVQQASQWLSSLNEGVQAGMTSDERKGYSIAHGLGGVLGYLVPGEAAWNLAGSIGKLGVLSGGIGAAGEAAIPFARIATPIGRAAMQGALATGLLEGGGDQSNQEAAFKVSMGAIGGAAFHAIFEDLPAVFSKVRSTFKAQSDPFVETPMSERRAPETEDADWWYAADREIPGTPTNQRRLTAGSTPVDPPGEAPAGWTQAETPQPAGQPFEQPDQLADVSRRLMSPERAATTEKILGLTEQRDVARRMMETDALTGAGNKMALTRAMGSVDGDPSLGWAVFDGKQFKAVNDAHGHQVGDQVLQNFHRAMEQTAQEMQIPVRTFRQGGDEFAAVVPRDQLEAFTRRATDLSEQVVGGVRTRLDGFSAANFNEADLALMRQKQLGRTPITQGNLPGELSAAMNRRAGWAAQGNEVMVRTLDENIEAIRSQMAEPAVAAARNEAAQLSKQATLMEGPTVPELAQATDINEADVVKSAIMQNPERINVIQGVGDMGKTIRSLAAGQIEGRIMPHQFRVVERAGGLDLLVSDGLPITNKRANQYKEHGFFDGQHATVNGQNVVVNRTDVGDGMTEVINPYTSETTLVARDNVLPARNSVPDGSGLAAHGNDLYKGFKEFVGNYMNTEAAKMPEGAKVDTDWLSTETSSQLPRLMDSYLSQAGVNAPVSRAAVESYFNVRRVADYAALAPEEQVHLQDLTSELNQLAESQEPPYVTTEEMAASKLLSFFPAADGAGGTMVDQVGDLRVPVDSEHAAREFLRTFNREVPDYTPHSEVPVEVGADSPHASNPGIRLEPHQTSDARDYADDVTAAADEIHALTQPQPSPNTGSQSGAAGASTSSPGAARGSGAVPPTGGGAGSPPTPPRGPGAAAAAGGPGRGNNLNQAFQNAATRNPNGLARAMDYFDSGWFKLMEPFEHAISQIDDNLRNIGVQSSVWKDTYNIRTLRQQAHNEALPWHEGFAGIDAKFHRKLLRTGEVMRVQSIANQTQKNAAMQAAGYRPRDIQAQSELNAFFDTFLEQHTGDPLAGHRMQAYLNDVRQAQSLPANVHNPLDAFVDRAGRLTPELKFIESMLSAQNMQVRQLDAGTFGAKLIRAAHFDRIVQPSLTGLQQRWNQPDIPSEVKDFLNDWSFTVKHGHNPGPDHLLVGLRYTMNALGVPVTTAEVQSLVNMGLTTMYRSAIGGQLYPIFRDSIQPWFAGVRIGFSHVAGAYGRYLQGGATKAAMIARAEQGGWLEKNLVKVANADIFEPGVYNPQGQNLLTPGQQAFRDRMAGVGDVVHDLTPEYFRHGLQGTKVDPLRYYGKLQETNRIISGDAGWHAAHDAIGDYSKAIMQLNNTPGITPAAWTKAADEAMQTLMVDARAIVYPRPVQDEFRQLVSSAQFEDAKILMGRKAADSQQRYGSIETSEAVRKMGYVGRLGMQLGSFTQGFVADIKQMSLNPDIPKAEKAKMLTRYAAVRAAIGAATLYTGWNFNKWAWDQSLSYAGGPMAQGIGNMMTAGSGAIASMTGFDPNRQQSDAMRNFSLAPAAEWLNPLAGVGRSISGVYDMAVRSDNPVEGTGRFLVTGEASEQPDIRQWIDRMGDQAQANADRLAAGQRMPVFGVSTNAPAAYNPADSSTPGLVRYNKNGYPVYNSTNVDPNGQVPTHRTDLPSGRLPSETWEQYEARVLARPITSFSPEAYQTTNDPNMLHPEVRDSLTRMLAVAHQEGVPLRIAETYRPQDRQELLFQEGRSRPGQIHTWTLTSDHAQHNAADLMPVGHMETGFRWIQENAPKFGFSVMGSSDPGHVSMPQAGDRGHGGGKGAMY